MPESMNLSWSIVQIGVLLLCFLFVVYVTSRVFHAGRHHEFMSFVRKLKKKEGQDG